jgi:hypothetical protein
MPESSLGRHDDDGTDPTTPAPPARGLMSRPAFVIPASFALAAVAGLTAERLAPPDVADLAAVCAVWVALYPISRLKPRIPWWNHWLQGIVIVFVFWLVTRASK